MWTFRILFAFDALALLVLGYFFLDGLQYVAPGDVTYFTTWLPLLAIPFAMLLGAWILREKGRQGWAIAVLGVLAVPPALMGLFLGLILITNPHWQ